MMTDPIADLLTRIRNANSIERPTAEVNATKLKTNIVRVLKEEGFVLDYMVGKYEGTEFKEGVEPGSNGSILRIYLKYGQDGEKVIRAIRRASKPGRRQYLGKGDLKKVLDGLGISILSTSKGVLSDRQARKVGVGGEIICYVW